MRRIGRVVTGHEQLRRPQDQQRGSAVPDLKRGDADHQSSQPAVQHGPDLDPDRLMVALLGRRGMPDRIDDRHRRQQPRDHREEDSGPDAHHSDQPDRQQRPSDGAQVIHRPLEPISPAIGLRWHQVSQQRVPGGHPKTPRGPGRSAEDTRLPRSWNAAPPTGYLSRTRVTKPGCTVRYAAARRPDVLGGRCGQSKRQARCRSSEGSSRERNRWNTPARV